MLCCVIALLLSTQCAVFIFSFRETSVSDIRTQRRRAYIDIFSVIALIQNDILDCVQTTAG